MSSRNVRQQNDLAILNDEFTEALSLREWQTHHGTENFPSFVERVKIIEEEGVFLIQPQSSGWYGEFHRGPYYFKEVAGNFTVTTRVHVTGKKEDVPESSYSLAGLMVRQKRPGHIDRHEKGHENWLFLSAGSATKKGKPQLESKNTVRGKSKLKVFSGKPGWVHVAISRIGDMFYQSFRYDDDINWTLIRAVHRPDFQSTVQVGMLAYTDFWRVAIKVFLNRSWFNTRPIQGRPDLVARYDYVRFYRIDAKAKPLEYEKGFHQSIISENELSILKL